MLVDVPVVFASLPKYSGFPVLILDTSVIEVDE